MQIHWAKIKIIDGPKGQIQIQAHAWTRQHIYNLEIKDTKTTQHTTHSIKLYKIMNKK